MLSKKLAKTGTSPDYPKKLTQAQINRKIEKISGMTPESISQLPRTERNEVLQKLRTAGLTIGELERATGISRGIITNAR